MKKRFLTYICTTFLMIPFGVNLHASEPDTGIRILNISAAGCAPESEGTSTAQTVITFQVVPKVEKFFHAFTAFDPGCNPLPSWATWWSVTRKPKHGSLRFDIAFFAMPPEASVCVGVVMPWKAAYYTWTDTTSDATQDSFSMSAHMCVNGFDFGPDFDYIAEKQKGTATNLVSFTTTSGGELKVEIEWKTATETDNAGFNLYRARDKNGKFKKINPAIIPALGDATSGAQYSFEDTVSHPGVYFYKLKDINASNKSTSHGPFKVKVKSK